MNLTLKTDYCLRVLIYLQTHPGKTKIQDIADSYNISKNHLSVAVHKLSELNYVLSTPGPHGGIEFNSEKANNTVGELISKIEELTIVECFSPKTNTCNLSPHCKLKKMIANATEAFVGVLKKHKIRDLV